MSAVKYLMMVITFTGLSSCMITTTTTYTRTIKEPKNEYMGNEYKDMTGWNENKILQKMSSPRRREPDGAGGTMLVYEDVKIVTDGHESYSSNSNTTSYTNYGNYEYITGNSTSQASTNNTSRIVTKEQKNFINFFINKEGKCYNVTTNIGDKWKYTPGVYQDCYQKYKRADPGILVWWLSPPFNPWYYCYNCIFML